MTGPHLRCQPGDVVRLEWPISRVACSQHLGCRLWCDFLDRGFHGNWSPHAPDGAGKVDRGGVAYPPAVEVSRGRILGRDPVLDPESNKERERGGCEDRGECDIGCGCHWNGISRPQPSSLKPRLQPGPAEIECHRPARAMYHFRSASARIPIRCNPHPMTLDTDRWQIGPRHPRQQAAIQRGNCSVPGKVS